MKNSLERPAAYLSWQKKEPEDRSIKSCPRGSTEKNMMKNEEILRDLQDITSFNK